MPRKRVYEEMEQVDVKPPPHNALLDKIRNMSEFAALMQYLFFFGKAVKVEEMEVEDFEQECLMPTHSEKLSELGLSLLKFVSSHRGLTFDIWDEYTRRQYVAKAAERNPYGTEEEPKKFAEFDIFTKLRVLYQLSLWTLWNPDRIREKMPESTTEEQTEWRIEPYGWDAEQRTYFLLDDDRLYRQTEPPIPKPVVKAKAAKPKPKPRAKGSRTSKRRRTSPAVVDDEEDVVYDAEAVADTEEDRGLDYEENYCGRKWECIAVTLDDYNQFLDSIKRSRDLEERSLHTRITKDVIPILHNKEEERQRKAVRRMRELENLQKLATAKRSSRLAGKMEQRKADEEAAEAERKRLADLEMAHKEQERQRKMGEARESRMMTREQRLKEREVKRILHEEQLAKEQEQLAALEREGALPNGEKARISERQLKADMEKRKKELEGLVEEDWVFDCAVCGVYGQNLDDGTASIACEKCNVWQHSACHAIDPAQAEREDFHFTCKDCKRKAEAPIPPLKLKFGPSSADEKLKAENKPASNSHPPGSTVPLPQSTASTSKIVHAPALSPQAQSPSPSGGIGVTGLHIPPPVSQGQHLVYPGPPPPLPRSASQSHPVNSSYASLPPRSPTTGVQVPSFAASNGSPASASGYPRLPANYGGYPPYSDTGHYQPRPGTPNGSFLPGNAQPRQYQANNINQQRPVSNQSNQGFNQAASFSSPSNSYGMSANSSFSATPRVLQSAHGQMMSSMSPPLQGHGTPHSARVQQPALQGSSPGYSPVKQSSPLPYSSHIMSETRVVPPVSLSPDERPQIRSPPVKKLSPILPQQLSPNGSGFAQRNGS